MQFFADDLVVLTDWVPGLEGDSIGRPGQYATVLAVPRKGTAEVRLLGQPGTWHVPFNRLEMK